MISKTILTEIIKYVVNSNKSWIDDWNSWNLFLIFDVVKNRINIILVWLILLRTNPINELNVESTNVYCLLDL